MQEIKLNWEHQRQQPLFSVLLGSIDIGSSEYQGHVFVSSEPKTKEELIEETREMYEQLNEKWKKCGELHGDSYTHAYGNVDVLLHYMNFLQDSWNKSGKRLTTNEVYNFLQISPEYHYGEVVVGDETIQVDRGSVGTILNEPKFCVVFEEGDSDFYEMVVYLPISQSCPEKKLRYNLTNGSRSVVVIEEHE